MQNSALGLAQLPGLTNLLFVFGFSLRKPPDGHITESVYERNSFGCQKKQVLGELKKKCLGMPVRDLRHLPEAEF